MKTEDLQRVEKSFTHALEGKLGKLLKPLTSQGVEDPADVEAVKALTMLRLYLRGKQ